MRTGAPRTFLLAASVLLACAAAADDDFGDLEFNYMGYVESAYLSRGKVVEDRPIQANLLTLFMKFGPYGDFGLWHWNYQSLTPRRREVADRLFREFDWAVGYQNEFAVAEDWTVKAELQPRLFTFPFMHSQYRGDCHRIDTEIWGRLALKNPYLTPSVMMRRGIKSKDYTYFKIGLSHTFPIIGDLTITPAVFAEMGNERTFEQRYGEKLGGGNYHTGIQAVDFALRFDYRLNEWLSFFAAVTQFDIVSKDARDKTCGPVQKRDYTYCSVGVSFTY